MLVFSTESSYCEIFHSLAVYTEFCISFMIRDRRVSVTPTTTEKLLSVRYIFLVLKLGPVEKIGHKYAEDLEVWCCRRMGSIAPIV